MSQATTLLSPVPGTQQSSSSSSSSSGRRSLSHISTASARRRTAHSTPNTSQSTSSQCSGFVSLTGSLSSSSGSTTSSKGKRSNQRLPPKSGPFAGVSYPVCRRRTTHRSELQNSSLLSPSDVRSLPRFSRPPSSTPSSFHSHSSAATWPPRSPAPELTLPPQATTTNAATVEDSLEKGICEHTPVAKSTCTPHSDDAPSWDHSDASNPSLYAFVHVDSSGSHSMSSTSVTGVCISVSSPVVEHHAAPPVAVPLQFPELPPSATNLNLQPLTHNLHLSGLSLSGGAPFPLPFGPADPILNAPEELPLQPLPEGLVDEEEDDDGNVEADGGGDGGGGGGDIVEVEDDVLDVGSRTMGLSESKVAEDAAATSDVEEELGPILTDE